MDMRRWMRWAVGMALVSFAWGTWAAGAGQTYVWIENCQPYIDHAFALRLTWDEAASGEEPIPLNVSVRGNDIIDNAYLTVEIRDGNGKTYFAERKNLLLDTDYRGYSFSWNAADAPCGKYTIAFSLKRPPVLEVLNQTYGIRKATLDELRADVDDAANHVSQAAGLAESQNTAGSPSPYATMRAALAADMLAGARTALDSGMIARAARLMQYAKSTSIEALRESSPDATPVEWREVPEAPAAVRMVQGGFEGDGPQGGRPCFLFGLNVGTAIAGDEMARIARYGMHFAALTIPPERDAELASLTPVLDAAVQARVVLLASLAPDMWTAAMRESHKAALDESTGHINLADTEARALMERHISTVAASLASRGNLAALCLAEAPFLRFAGDTVKQGFLENVKGEYADRAAVNRSWKGLFADFNEIEIGWNRVSPRYQDSPAYRYDWQRYHQSLIAQWADSAKALVRSAAPQIPVTLATSSQAFETEDVALAVDREALATSMDLSACTAGNTPGDLFYAIGYPQQVALYTLLRSFGPEKPLANVALRLFDGDTWETPCSFERGHTIAWEAAMAGLDAAALVVPTELMRPEGLEGYAAAALDLNRLAPIVTAFQNAPADVRILYCTSSKIYADGAPHLSSARFAFEGCSFAGYKLAYVTEQQIIEGALKTAKVLVVPDTEAVSEAAFPFIKEYMQGDECVIRTSTSILFDEHGHSRRDIITPGRRTVHVRGENLPAEYLHAMDGAIRFGSLPMIPHIVNTHGYPLEGIKSLYAEHDGSGYLYLVSLRKDTQVCQLQGGPCAGRDLIAGRDVHFPLRLEPLDPMLIRLDPSAQPANRKAKHVRQTWEMKPPTHKSKRP